MEEKKGSATILLEAESTWAIGMEKNNNNIWETFSC